MSSGASGSRLRRAVLAAALLGAAAAAPLSAQVRPNAHWRTLDTKHFHIHFTPGLEPDARRAAVIAEQAYAGLAAQMHPPRGPIDLTIADNVDYSNGSATPLPSNRIVIYAHPPVDASSLRFYSDWETVVISHELTHIFHLDRATGWWGAAQHVFGRNPVLFPNLYLPAWITEGLAVYEESRLTGTGRIAGSEHRMIARANALEPGISRLSELSLASPRFPGGEASYAFGSLLLDYMARDGRPGGVHAFVEATSHQPIPFLLDRAARRAFGMTFEQAWTDWRDSLRDLVGPGALARLAEPAPGWRTLTHAGRSAFSPRWLDDSALVFSGSPGYETAGVWRVDLDGRVRRIGRRNGLDPNVPLAGGGLLFAQPDYVDPYDIRSDLYIQRGSHARRLTRAARLARPDARADGRIVAVRAVPASTELVLVSPDGKRIDRLTRGTPDTQWAEPRWSPDGARIAAVRWTRGAWSDVVVLDTTGAVVAELAHDRAVSAAPAWTPDGRAIVYASDRTGTTQLYLVPAPTAAEATDGGSGPARVTLRLTDAVTGIFEPDVAPDGRSWAATLFRADGYHIGVAPLDTARAVTDTVTAAERARDTVTMPPPAVDSGPVHRYSPWPSLLPRYWIPIAIASDFGHTLAGALTSGSDVVGRHAYVVQGAAAFTRPVWYAEALWRWAGLGMPLLDLDVHGQAHEQVPVRGGGWYQETESGATLAATVTRPRFRTYAWGQLGAELYRFHFGASVDTLLPAIGLRTDYDRRGVFLAGGWSDAQYTELGISPEDGVSVSGSARERWYPAIRGTATRSILGAGDAYKSLPLPGFAHHVLALHAAAAWRDERTVDLWSVGGVSGASIEVVPGYSVGDEARAFFVRGFPAGAREGTQALGASAEYRAPLWLPGRGLGLLPLFFDRSSLALFGDAATTRCPPSLAICRLQPGDDGWIASVGGELRLDAALFSYDMPYRLRVGLAVPVARDTPLPVSSASLYFSAGTAF